MGKKHFLCTHTWTNEQARDQFLNIIGQMTDREYLAAVSTEQAELLQTWLGQDDFFFCHWFADSEEAIHSAIELSGTHELIVTLASQAPIVVSSFDLKDTKLLNRLGH